MKLHIDFGKRKFKDNDLNLFASSEHNKSFKNFVWKVGGTYFTEKMDFHGRFKIYFKEGNQYVIESAKKATIRKGKWTIDGYRTVDWTNLGFLKNALQIGYKHNDNNEIHIGARNHYPFKLKHLTVPKLFALGDEYFFNYVRKINDTTKAGFEVNSNVIFRF